MRRRLVSILTALVVVMSFHSCDQITDINLFKEAKLGQVTQEQLAAMDAETIVKNSGATDTEASESFYTALSEASPSTQAAVVAKLQDYFASDPQDPLWLELSFANGEPVVTQAMARRSRPIIPQTPTQREMELLTLTSLTTQLPLQSGLPYNVLAAMNATAGGLLGRPMNTINLSDVVYGMRNIPQYIFSDYTLTTIIVRQMLYLSRVLSTLSTEVLGPNDNRYWNTHSAAQMRSLGQIATLVMVIAFYDPYPGVYLGEYGNIIVIPGPRIPQDPANLLARLSVALHAVVNTPSFIFWSNGATMENLKMLYHTGSGQEFKDLIIRAVQTGLLSRILAAGSMNFNSLWPVSP